MCGIIGIVGNTAGETSDATAHNMLKTLSQRGPDAQNFARFPSCLLGQTRLSIIDLATGNQPMRDNAEPLTIVFNGEIYNYKELRAKLTQKGHRFSTTSDTEVILKAYIEYGKDCPQYLDGQFAFAIWKEPQGAGDEDSGELFLARDRFGKKPLYYAFMEKTLFIASEIKALFAAGIKGEVNPAAIDDYLTLMYIPPWKSVYKNIHVLPPAYLAIWKDGMLVTKSYWSLSDTPLPSKNISYNEAREKIRELFDKAVKKRMLAADVEVGSLLSGGIDSTLVTAYAQKYVNHPIKTFSVGYEGVANELPYAKQASEKIGTDHYTLRVKDSLTDELEQIIAYMDEPHADSSNFPQHLISKLASTKVKVALSGDGADELFMGYGWYWKYWNVQKHVRLKNALSSNPFKEYIKYITVFGEKDRIKLWKDARFVEAKSDIIPKSIDAVKDNFQKINFFDLTTYLPGQLLTKIDRTSMMHSLEVRSPFLDQDLAEYVYRLPVEFKTDKKKTGKIILKDILSETMPEEFVKRRKQGFGAPVKQWLRTDEMKKFVYKHLDDKNACIYSHLKHEVVGNMLTAFYEKDDTRPHYKIWVLLCLELWFKKHQKNHVKNL